MATTDRPRPTASAACPECAGPLARTDTETVCQACGVVVEADPIDHGPDWGHAGPDGEDPRRAKPANRDHHDRGLGSTIADGGDLSARQRALHARSKIERKKDRNRGYATSEIHRMATALGWGDTLRTQAKRLFREVHEGTDQGGRDLDRLTAAAVYAVARVHQRGLAPTQVAAVARTDTTALRRSYGRLTRTLGLAVPPPDAKQRLRVVAREADVPDRVRERALAHLDALPDADVANGSPSTLVAGLLWAASDALGLGVTQARVCEAADCSKVGLRNRLRALPEVGFDE